jgi:hypothetical protein
MAHFDIPPGVVNEVSKKRNTSNWRETHLVRWERNTLRPVGGWEKLIFSGTFASRLREMHRWIDNSGIQWTAYLCEQHCYVESGDGTLVDITPEDGLEAPGAPGEGGYGDDVYGTEDYGEPRGDDDRINVITPTYTLGNWGEELRVMTSADGRLLRWSPSSPTDLLVAVENAPTGNRSFIVTPERFIMLFGAGGNNANFVWSDQEDDTEWTPGTTTKAGGFVIEPYSPIIAELRVPNGILMFSAQGGYLISFIGAPYYYNYAPITDCPPPLSAASIVEVPDGAFWPGLNGPWVYNGVSASPVDCPIWDWITDAINPNSSKRESVSINIPARFEVWFFFVSGADMDYNNRVVIYNYARKQWSMGKLGRTCGVSSPNDPYPLMSDGTNVWRHETGFNYPDLTELPWAETFSLNVGGMNMATIVQMLPEVAGGRDAVQFRLIKSTNPTSGPETFSDPKLIRTNGFVDIRETARDFRLRVEMVKKKEWSFGPFELTIAGRGSK